VACFASDILKIKAQVICGQFQPETLIKIGGVNQLSPEDQQLVPQAIQMLKDNPMRTFRVDVAADSMLYQDEQREKADRVEFLGAVSQYLEKAVQASQNMPPEATPLLMDLLKFGVTGFRIGKTVEGEFDNVADAIKERAKNPPPAQPDPEMMKIQAEMQMFQQKSQLEVQTRATELQNQAQVREHEIQLEAQRNQAQAQLEAQRAEIQAKMDAQLAEQKLEFERWKAQLDNETKILVAELDAKTKLKAQYMSANPADPLVQLDDNGNPSLPAELTNLLHDVNSSMETLVQTNMMAQQANADLVAKQQAAHEMLVDHLNRPKQVVRDNSGKIIGVK